MKSAVPALTRFDYVKAGLIPVSQAGGAVTADASIEGAGITPANATFRFFGASIFQTPKTTGWGIMFRAKLLGPTAARIAVAGLFNAAMNHGVEILVDPVGSATNYILAIVGGATTTVASTVACNQAYHNFGVTSNATTMTLWVDGVAAASTATYTNIADEPMFPAAYNTIAGESVIARIRYGYTTP
jgi:hypothetical protein